MSYAKIVFTPQNTFLRQINYSAWLLLKREFPTLVVFLAVNFSKRSQPLYFTSMGHYSLNKVL